MPISQINYIVLNHNEPDHSGALPVLLDMNPDMEVLYSKTAKTFVENIVNRDFKGARLFGLINQGLWLFWISSRATTVSPDERGALDRVWPQPSQVARRVQLAELIKKQQLAHYYIRYNFMLKDILHIIEPKLFSYFKKYGYSKDSFKQRFVSKSLCCYCSTSSFVGYCNSL